ncbi:hypothetical protein D3C80_1782460 [compost metagenome]
MQRSQGGLVLQQPELQLVRPTKYPIQRIEANAAQGEQFDHRFEGNGKDQAFVFFPGGDMP